MSVFAAPVGRCEKGRGERSSRKDVTKGDNERRSREEATDVDKKIRIARYVDKSDVDHGYEAPLINTGEVTRAATPALRHAFTSTQLKHYTEFLFFGCSHYLGG
ncbi:hypothetical protein O3P69_012177 [Scylla paramamosain]|uniref:Uncharacterized protein n=1 Tax=Scylla paramamosain TaxID=85552 RepID=A0AAW0TC14_SCYPA